MRPPGPIPAASSRAGATRALQAGVGGDTVTKLASHVTQGIDMWRITTALAAALLLAACSSTPESGETATQTETETSVETETTGGGESESGTTAETGDVEQESLDGDKAGAGAATQEGLIAAADDRVFFGFDDASLTDDAKRTVEAVSRWLQQHEQVRLTIEGHADERGTREYNLALGARRANAVQEYLVALGVAPDRLQTVSYGEERPAVLGSNQDAWAKNRRAVFVVKDGSGETS